MNAQRQVNTSDRELTNATEFWKLAIQDAWNDETFRNELSTDPQAALMSKAGGDQRIIDSIDRYAHDLKGLTPVRDPLAGEGMPVPGRDVLSGQTAANEQVYLYPPTCC